MAANGATSSEILFTASLFAGLVLIVSPMIRKKLLDDSSPPWKKKVVSAIDWAPFVFAFLAWAIDLFAFVTLNLEHQRVAEIIASDAGFFVRINGALSGWLSLAMAFVLGFGLYLGFVLSSLHKLSTFELSEMTETDYIRLSHNLRRWGGWLWFLMLYGLMPDNPFPVGDGVSTGGIELGGLGQSVAMWFAMLMFGLMTGIGVLQLALLMERADRFHDSKYFPNNVCWYISLPLTSLLAVMFLLGTLESYDPLSALLLDPIFSKRITFIFALSIIFIYAATGLKAHIISEQRLKVGSKRWRGMAFGLSHHLLLVWGSTILLAHQLPNVQDMFGAIWLGTLLVIPGFIAGLLGMLLPVAGWDDRPRPEYWGFRLMQALSLPFIVAWMPLAILSAPGILVGVSTSAIIAPLSEENPRVRPKFRKDATIAIIGIDIIFLLILFSPPLTLGMVLAFAFASFAATVPLTILKRVRPA